LSPNHSLSSIPLSPYPFLTPSLPLIATRADLFQHIAFEFYGHIIANNASAGLAYPSGAEEYRDLYLRRWFRYVSPGFKTCAMLVLLVFCYLVQWLYQDVFIAWLYSRVMQALASRANKR
jgi:hypothetical protein